MVVNEKESSLPFKKKNATHAQEVIKVGAFSRDDAQGKIRGKYSQNEKRAKKIYRASDGQTNDVEKAKKSAKYETEYRAELAGNTIQKKFSQLSV